MVEDLVIHSPENHFISSSVAVLNVFPASSVALPSDVMIVPFSLILTEIQSSGFVIFSLRRVLKYTV